MQNSRQMILLQSCSKYMHRKVLQPTVMVEPNKNEVDSGLVSTDISTKSHLFWLGLCTVNSLNVCLRMLHAICYNIFHNGRWNRSGGPGDCRTNVCCIVPKKPADMISGTDNQLLGMGMSLIAGLNRLLYGILQ